MYDARVRSIEVREVRGQEHKRKSMLVWVILRNCKDVGFYSEGKFLLKTSAYVTNFIHIFRLVYTKIGTPFHKELNNKYFRHMSLMVSVAVTQFHHCSVKAAIGHRYKMGSCDPLKLHLQNMPAAQRP